MQLQPLDISTLTVPANSTEFVDFTGAVLSVTESTGDILFRPEQNGHIYAKMNLIVGAVIPIEGGFHRMHFINEGSEAVTLSYMLAAHDVTLPPSVGAVEVSNTTPIPVTETKETGRVLLATVTLAGTYVALPEGTLLPDSYSRIEIYTEDCPRCIVMRRTTYEKIKTMYDRDFFAMANGIELVLNGAAGKAYVWGVKNG